MFIPLKKYIEDAIEKEKTTRDVLDAIIEVIGHGDEDMLDYMFVESGYLSLQEEEDLIWEESGKKSYSRTEGFVSLTITVLADEAEITYAVEAFYTPIIDEEPNDDVYSRLVYDFNKSLKIVKKVPVLLPDEFEIDHS